MKKLIFILVYSLLIFNYSHSYEIIDCSKLEKIKAKIDCKAKNLKSKLNEEQSKAKEKIENLDSSNTGKKFKKSKLGKALIKFKKSKTGSDFLKKNDD